MYVCRQTVVHILTLLQLFKCRQIADAEDDIATIRTKVRNFEKSSTLKKRYISIMKDIILFYHFMHMSDNWAHEVMDVAGSTLLPRHYLSVQTFIETKRAEWTDKK